MRPPQTVQELLARAEALAGRTLGWLASQEGLDVPPDLRRHKGWIGTLLEAHLGATAGSRAEQDFPHLGVELKTLPVDREGKPTESTYVCIAPLDGSMARTWDACWVRQKLSRVLWIPIVTAPALQDRRIGAPVLWRPSPEEEAQLRADWESIAEAIHLGETWQLEARRGRALQLRPKAASSKELTWMLDEEGEWAQVNPRGFYLRTSFTRAMLRRHLAAR
ncbi:MAG: DNA mismatch repair endonuclease MutH [Deltaproteobacteria bacterium]|nr:MAG: DNA mismatch repair endonuclease MutH [Deltaproteobacteria bacterium]